MKLANYIISARIFTEKEVNIARINSKKAGKMYSLEYIELPKVFFTGVDISTATKGITNVTTVSNATMVPKLITVTVCSKVTVAIMFKQ
jgi:hypothetical protein